MLHAFTVFHQWYVSMCQGNISNTLHNVSNTLVQQLPTYLVVFVIMEMLHCRTLDCLLSWYPYLRPQVDCTS